MDIKHMMLEDFGKAGAFLALYVVIFLLAKWTKDFFTPYKISDELAKNDNFSIALCMSGYYLATAAIFIGALSGPSHGFTKDLILVAEYSLLGLVFLNVSRFINEKIVLRKFCDTEQLVKEHNLSVGAVHFGTYLATGLIAAAAVSGQGGGVLSATVFFVLGQISLFIFSFVYNFFTPYNIHEELEKKNVAVGVAYGGTLVALGIIILNGVAGDFVNWQEDLTLFAIANVMAFVFLPVARFLMDKLVMPGYDLGKEIRDDKNLGAGILEATVAISFAVILVQLI